ncbi:MAG: ATP-binding protein [Candidatus Micrarchaeaceae archaeon]
MITSDRPGDYAINLAPGFDIDIQAIMTGRGCIIGQSGSGKSFLAGVMAEELCRSNMPLCVIDTEGEYASLKGISNVIIVGGANSDVGVDIDYQKLFSASISSELPVVLDVSDAVDKKEIVYRALEALYKVENNARKPYLVMIEEADKFAPQIISKEPNVIEEISVRGRKRGIGLLIATQRPANISKNVLSQCSYGFIGRLTIENDLNAIKILFESRSRLVSITKLGVGEFIPFGLGDAKKFKVKPRSAKHTGMTPVVESSKVMGNRLNAILKDLRSTPAGPEAKKGAQASPKLQIHMIHASFSYKDAESYAKQIARRRFVVFGDAAERIDSLDITYLPLGSFRIRVPTSHRNEYLEYNALVNGKCEFARLDKGISFKAMGADQRGSYRNYLKKSVPLERATVDKANIMKGIVSEKHAENCIKKILPRAIVVDFQTVYLPVYSIVLRQGNKVRIVTIDGMHGKDINIGI